VNINIITTETNKKNYKRMIIIYYYYLERIIIIYYFQINSIINENSLKNVCAIILYAESYSMLKLYDIMLNILNLKKNAINL